MQILRFIVTNSTPLLSLSSDSKEEMQLSTKTVLFLFFFLIALLVLLFLLYKKLNRETNGEYTVHRMVYKEGGVRDRMRAAVLTVEGHLGFQLWPHSDNDIENMDGEDDVERQEEDENSQASDSGGEDDQENPENDSTDPSNTSEGKGGENSSVEDVEEGEHRRLMVAADVTNETSEDTEKKIEENKKVEGGEGTGLLIDLKQFSGSAIWSEEDVGDSKGGDLTAL